MEATIHYNKKGLIAIALIFTAILLAFAIHASNSITKTVTIPSIEVMRWSEDTCWGDWR